MNREYKSDVFSMLMIQPEYALDVYNALNETKYDDPGLIEILQLEKGISLTVRNDASFINPDVEVICTMININKEFSGEYSGSRVLLGYSEFVEKVRTHQQQMDVSEALECAIDECIKENILPEFFSKHRQEVRKVAMLDYTFERQIELEKRDSFAEGKSEGKLEGLEEGKIQGKAEMIILMGHEVGWDNQEIIKYMMKQMSLSYEDAKRTFDEINS